MSVIGHSPLAGASGAAGGAEATYVDDVFSTFLYEGNASGQGANAQSISNSIDLSGEGGLVWIKNRELGGSSAWSHYLFDTERGATKYLKSNDTGQEQTINNSLSAFNSDGFTLGETGGTNNNGSDYVSWTFRKAPGFFDVVTYTGTGSAQNISHSLGSVPGMIIIHCRDGTHDWEVYHRSTGATKSLHLNNTDAQATDSTVWNNTTPTSSVFTVGTSSNVNQNGHGYVAYVFAHDDQSFGTSGDESVINCGSFTTDSSGAFTAVNLGWEPQWLLIKRSDSSTAGSWLLLDNMRGLGAGASTFLYPNLNNAEASNSVGFVHLTPTGFKGASSTQQQANATYIYMAIRRPHKPPTAATEVFNADYEYGTDTSFSGYLGYVADMNIINVRAGNANNSFLRARLTGDGYLATSNTAGQVSQTIGFWDNMLGFYESSGTLDTGKIQYIFRRAPGFFDVVTYTGTGSARTVTHNLGAVPELMIVKVRNFTYNWFVYAAPQGNSKYGLFSETYGDRAFDTDSAVWNSTTPTSTQFSVGTAGGVNGSGYNYISYLFASLDGISEVGSYSGTGNNVNVDCGFTAGARFVLIKRTDSTGDWYVYDTVRGIVSGNDPYLLLNSNAAQVTNTDYIDPLNAGFTVTSSAPAALNASGGTYLFLAIA